MPYLMVDLNDANDCQQAIKQLRQQVQNKGKNCGREPGGQSQQQTTGAKFGNQQEKTANEGTLVQTLPLRKKLMRIRERGIWPHLVEVAKLGIEPRSLPEFDQLLTLPRNKMRSLKAIMAKLENRFDLQFLLVNEDAGKDESGNPRYSMPTNVRRQILKLAEE